MFTKQSLLLNWRSVKPYVIFSTLLFFASIVVGGASQGPVVWLDKVLEQVASIAQDASDSTHPEKAFFVAIVLNNVKSSLAAMYLGVMGGVMPIATLVVNGMLLGYLFGMRADAGLEVWPVILKSVLPHGIFEIPALLLACACGIRLGFSFVKSIFAVLIGKDRPWSGFSFAIRGTIPAAVLIVAMLLVAAGIESTVSYWLSD